MKRLNHTSSVPFGGTADFLDFVKVPLDAAGEKEHEAFFEREAPVLRELDRRRADTFLSHLGQGQSAQRLPVRVGPLVRERKSIDLRGRCHRCGFYCLYPSPL